MEYKIALAPNLGITAAEFEAAWNATPESRNAAQVRLDSVTGSSFFDPATDAAIAVLTGMVGNTIYDLIKAKVLALWTQMHPGASTLDRDTVKVLAVDQPDGTQILVVTVEKE